MSDFNLSKFFNLISDKILFSFDNHNFESIQHNLLKESFYLFYKKSEKDFFSSPLFIFYAIIKIFNKKINEQSISLGAFIFLYLLSLDLFDDVQDEDLIGKPYEKVGVPIAINNAITLLFISLEFLFEAINLEENSIKKSEYLKVFNEVSIKAVKGQHKDLIGENAVKNSDDVINMQKEKTSSISLISKCATIFSDCNNFESQKINSIFENVTVVFQIVDDIKDIYGKNISPDLITNKITYPIFCFKELASKEELYEFDILKKSLPESIRKIRKLIYNSGAIKKSSEVIEDLRVSIHKDFSSLQIYNPNIRTILYSIDYLASSIYKIKPIEDSSFIIKNNNKWDLYVDDTLNQFFQNIKMYNPPPKIDMLPWHLPQWMYDFNRKVIFYSDLDGYKNDIIPYYFNFIGTDDFSKVENIIIEQIPFSIAHEFFHYWRDFLGKITKDYWYEEYVSNCLAISYIKEFSPYTYNKNKENLNLILNNSSFLLDDYSYQILNRIFNIKDNSNLALNGYEVETIQASIIQANLIKFIMDKDFSLNYYVEKFLNV